MLPGKWDLNMRRRLAKKIVDHPERYSIGKFIMALKRVIRYFPKSRLICTWRGKVVLSGLAADPHNWSMEKLDARTQ